MFNSSSGFSGDIDLLGNCVVYALPTAEHNIFGYVYILTLGANGGDRAQLVLAAGGSAAWTRGSSGANWSEWKELHQP